MTSSNKESLSPTSEAKADTIEANSRILPIRSRIDIPGQPDFRNITRRRHRRSRRNRARDLLRPDSLNPMLRGTIIPSSARRIA